MKQAILFIAVVGALTILAAAIQEDVVPSVIDPNVRIHADDELEPLLHDKFLEETSKKTNLWKAGYNKAFEGLSLADAKRMFPVVPKNHLRLENLPSGIQGMDDIEIPEEYDTRKAFPECTGPILNQGTCGSCWAFGTSTTVRDRFCIQSNGKIKDLYLAPQALIDCDFMDSGCGGGTPEVAMNYMSIAGIPEEYCNPYHMRNGSYAPTAHACPLNCKDGSVPYKYYTKWDTIRRLPTIRDMQLAILNGGPVVFTHDVYRDWFAYKGGIYRKTSDEFIGGHAVRVFGWGVEKETDTAYWIVANSHGALWGEEGFYRFIKGINECKFESDTSAVDPDVERVYQHPPPPKPEIQLSEDA